MKTRRSSLRTGEAQRTLWLREAKAWLLCGAVLACTACGSGGGSADAGLPPTLSYAGASGTTNNVGTPMSVSPTTLTPNGSAVTACGIKPGSANAASFPATLSVNAASCVISGTPAAALPTTVFTLVASNAGGVSADAVVSLSFHAGWLKQLGAASQSSYAYAVALDSAGGSYVAGTTSGGLNGNSQTGLYDYFIAKYDALGALSWLKQLGSASGSSGANAVAVDAQGNSYVAGFTNGGLNGGSQTGIFDMFLAKYDASGTLLWLAQLGVAAQEAAAYGVAVDAQGNSYVAGYTEGGLAGNSQTGQNDYFIAKYDATGALSWLKQMGVALKSCSADGVAVDASGNIYLSGATSGGLHGSAQTGKDDAFIAKYDASGVLIWLTQLGAAAADTEANGVALDTDGNSYLGGLTSGGLNGNSLSGVYDSFVAKFDASGTLSWVRQLGAASQQTYGYGVAVDASGNSYLVGYTTGGLDGHSQSGVDDYFIAKHDNSGTLTWLTQAGAAAGDSEAYAVAVDGFGNSHLAGYTTVGLAGNVQTGAYDFFLANYNAAGSF